MYLVAVKTNSVKSIFLKKPSIVIGDFLILPTIVGLIAYYYQNREYSLADIFSPAWVVVAVIIGFLQVSFSAIKSHLFNTWWLSRLLSQWVVAAIIVYFLITNFKLASAFWWIVLIGVIAHKVLGIVYPKEFPEIRN